MKNFVHSGKALINTRLFPLVLLILGAALSACSRNAVQVIDLSGEWRFRQGKSEEWRPAQVPGCVHTDLWANGLIDDPFYRDNEKRLAWIGQRNWIYEREFQADPSLFQRQHVRLLFRGLDTHARVTLNDSLLFFANNMFRSWSAECGSLLRPGKNVIRVTFYSPLRADSMAAASLPYTLPDNRAFSRKAPYQYGWDWGPAFPTMGIWRPVSLEVWDGPRLEDLQIFQDELNGERARLRACFEITSEDSCRASLSLNVLKTGISPLKRKVKLHPGLNRITLSCEIPSPRLWWPRGMGQQHLYELQGILTSGHREEKIRRRVGLRTLSLVQEPDSAGVSFYFTVNGVTLFAKGANYVPMDSFLPRATSEEYRQMISSVARANMNMLRVWGGGIYENDGFYDLCDEAGILVWQDFMFAGALYPADPLFLLNIEAEARENIKRLRNHPCLALWCGNNEIDEAWHNWGWQQQFGWSAAEQKKLRDDYRTIFHTVLPGAVALFDSGRTYWPSSPKIGWGRPEAVREGDMHYWGVWWGKLPFSLYKEKVGRFMSEYGFQGMPSLSSITRFTLPEDRSLSSPVLGAHQKHPFGWEAIDIYMKRDYRNPKDFSSYIYVSQLLQARGVGIALAAHLRSRPLCGGTLYWQLNDCWPVVSWSSIDYFGQWKALHYTARRLFRDVVLLPDEEGGLLSVSVSSDRRESISGRIEMKCIDFQGGEFWHASRPVTVRPLTTTRVLNLPLDSLENRVDPRRAVLLLELSDGDSVIARSSHYFVRPRQLELPCTEIKMTIAPHRRGCMITLKSDLLAKDVYLEAAGIQGWFSDNFFDLLPGEEKIVTFVSEVPGTNVADSLRVRSLRDTY